MSLEISMQRNDGAWSLSAKEAGVASRRPEAYGQRGMVASAHPAAAVIGNGILARGGNAFDAAIGVAAAEGVLLPMMCGIGGDAFVIVHDARRGETIGYNGSGVAATGASREHFVSRGFDRKPLDGVHAVAVPGALSVYEAIHERHCTLEWADLWAPAIELAAEGVAVTDYVSTRIHEQQDRLSSNPYAARQFLPGGRAPAAGVSWTAPNLAKSLRAVASGGAEVFYQGELAERLLRFLSAEGARFTSEDFAGQTAVTYAPLGAEYRGVRLAVTAPPSQGVLLLAQMNIIEGFDPTAFERMSGERIHLLVEAKKLAFADRNLHAGDPKYVSWPLETLIS